jgi:hypothetical protein
MEMVVISEMLVSSNHLWLVAQNYYFFNLVAVKVFGFCCLCLLYRSYTLLDL